MNDFRLKPFQQFKSKYDQKERKVIYNNLVNDYKDLREFIRYYKLDEKLHLSEDDIKFLEKLYHIKKNHLTRRKWRRATVDNEILAKILYVFLNHFNVEGWRSYSSLQREIYRHFIPKKRTKLLFMIMPLTVGEYVMAVRHGHSLGLFKREPIGNGKNRRYVWEVVKNAGYGKTILERCSRSTA